jgi:hypothetical protein
VGNMGRASQGRTITMSCGPQEALICRLHLDGAVLFFCCLGLEGTRRAVRHCDQL